MNLAELDSGFDPRNDPNAGLHVEFYYHTSQDGKKSREEGRPIFREYEFIRVRVVGDKDSVIERPATEMDKRRFPVQYKQFLARETQKPEGFPLAEWPAITRSQVEELKYFNIHTVEQLASVSDANGQKFIGFIGIRDKAKKFLEQLAVNAPLEKVQSELAQRDAQIADLTRQLQALTAKVQEMDDA